ncbi:hypothetical protein AMTRI_Chr10g226450 [Amborella trichopoda]
MKFSSLSLFLPKRGLSFLTSAPPFSANPPIKHTNFCWISELLYFNPFMLKTLQIPSQSRSFSSDFNPKHLFSTTECMDEQEEITPNSIENSKDADLITRILIEHHNPYHTMEASLQLNGVHLSPHLVNQVLLRLRNLSKIAMGFFVWAKEQALYKHDCNSYNTMINILGKVRQFDVAWQLIIEMGQEGNIELSEKTFGILIRRYIAAGFTRQAIRTFDDMESLLEKETSSSDFNMLLDTLCKYGFVKVATEIFNKRKYQYPPDIKTYTILIYGWTKSNKPAMAEKLFSEMTNKGLEPNAITYNVLLNGICRWARLQPEFKFHETVEKAERLIMEMKTRGVEPDATSYSIILHVYSRAHKPELVISKLRAMKQMGICPTIATYTSVIKCLCSSGRIGIAEELLDEMTSNGVSPSAATYNCFFKEYGGRKDSENALNLYRKLKEPSSLCTPSIHTYNILVGMFCKLDRMDIVLELWNDMRESGTGPDLDSYTLLVHGLCEKKKWRDACCYFVEMIEKGFLPQTVTFETLYRGLIQADMLRTWRRLKKKLEEESIKFSTEHQSYQFVPYKR